MTTPENNTADLVERLHEDLGDTTTHARTCKWWIGAPGREGPAYEREMKNRALDYKCTCSLRWRQALRTEREMHNAWRKRAEEAEAADALSRPLQPDTALINKAREMTGTITDELQHCGSDDLSRDYTHRGTLLFECNEIICGFLSRPPQPDMVTEALEHIRDVARAQKHHKNDIPSGAWNAFDYIERHATAAFSAKGKSLETHRS